MTDEPRVVAGRYRVDELLGHGGMSDVHRGFDTRLGRTVAVKLLKPTLATDPAFRTRFRQEAQSAARMAHPTIVRVFDAGEDTVIDDEGREVQAPFIIMEYVDGESLDAVIARGALDPDRAVHIAEGILTALEYSHRAGVVHRDIKPANILISRTGQVKVTDFGIARAISETSASLSKTTSVLGTASYFSPEQARNEQIDARTDLYSTGVVLFEMLTGRPPFRGDSPVAVAYQHISEIPAKPSSLKSDVSPALDTVVRKALQKDRFERYQTAADFRADVELAASGKVPRPQQRGPLVANPLLGGQPAIVSKAEASFRQLADDSKLTRTQSRPPGIWVIAGVLLVMAVIAALLVAVLNNNPAKTINDTAVTVPNVIGEPQATAEKALTEAHLKIVVEQESSATVAEGAVTRTDPGSGIVATKNTEVTMWVSTGAPKVTIPTGLENQSDAAVQATLGTLGVTQIQVTKTTSPDQPAGTVLKVDPAPGTAIDPAVQQVTLTESNGQVTIPDETNQPLDQATAALTALGLVVQSPVGDPGCTAQPGTPVSQQDKVGDQPQGSPVTLSYCLGDTPPPAAPSDTPTTPATPAG